MSAKKRRRVKTKSRQRTKTRKLRRITKRKKYLQELMFVGSVMVGLVFTVFIVGWMAEGRDALAAVQSAVGIKIDKRYAYKRRVEEIQKTIRELNCQLPEVYKARQCRERRTMMDGLWRSVRTWAGGEQTAFALWETKKDQAAEARKVRHRIRQLRREHLFIRAELADAKYDDRAFSVEEIEKMVKDL